MTQLRPESARARRSRLLVALQFTALGLVWGSSFLFMKVALGGVSFGQVAWTRLMLGALTLGILLLVVRTRMPRNPRVYLHFVVIGAFGCAVPYLLFAWAEQYVTSGLASIYNAVTPIATALMVTLAFRVEKLDRSRILGVTAGIIGVVVIIGPWSFVANEAAQGDLALELAGQLACLGSAVCYGFTFGYIRRFVTGHYPVTGLTAAFLQVGMGAVILLVLTPFVAIGPIGLDLPIVLSLLALGIAGTGVAYYWYMNVLNAWGPTATSTVTYLTPVVGVALGIVLLGETLSWNAPVGALLVFLGILLAQGRLRLPRRRHAQNGVSEAG
ncbi:DMT family transporter [Herbiconiux ginsengi]|uniref:Permease of the drug/metabolite transporter (DMT) superfamily n=1 Tax=Herbiconiux ginsengi TaxID=381665 RepID=A0A1H3MTQ1_9MICO|nr:DMT family transporter [Herbiconiux ginsengi]SDY79956.1 Permease of the drug/metabolite transporter (DMT) superfamily [Herbiconiux ginsengi]